MFARRTSACLTLVLAGFAVAAVGGDNLTKKRASTSLARITADMTYLASDELEGRGPATAGLRKAADFMIEEFKSAGLKGGGENGSYEQAFTIGLDQRVVKEKTELVFKGPAGKELRLDLGTHYQPQSIGGTGSAAAPVVFAGYGITAKDLEYDDYAELEVEGKVVIVIRREPQQGDESSKFDGLQGTRHAFIRSKVQQAKNRKAAALLVVNDPFTTKKEEAGDALGAATQFGGRSMEIPVAQITQDAVNQLLSAVPLTAEGVEPIRSVEGAEQYIDAEYRTLAQPLEGWTAELQFTLVRDQAEVHNIVGVIEGQGPHADETIVIGAHYDHLGYGGYGSRRPGVRAIHPGADDNASGTAAVIELARRFASREHPPARRLVFVGFSGEERGLHGSNFYVANPLFPLENTVAMFNFDMVGQVRNNQLQVHGVGTAKQFAAVVDGAIKDQPLEVQPSPGIMGASDHLGFYRKNIPVFHFFSGITAVYHTPDDSLDTINMEGIVLATDLVERLIEGVSDLPERPEFVQVRGGRRRPAAPPAAFIGITPDYSADAKEVSITEVRDDSPAARAGLQKGDVLLQLGDVKIDSVEALTGALRKYRPGQMVELKLRRGGETISKQLTLGALRPGG